MIANRAVVYLGSGRSRLERADLPEPGRGELILRLTVSGLCGTDLFKLANDTAAVGAVLGHEIVGIVEQAGAGSVLEFGTRVVVPHHVACGHCTFCRRGADTMCTAFRENLLFPGGFSDRVLVRERAVQAAAHALPDRLSDDAAVFLEPAACVLRGIRRSGILESPAPHRAAVLGGGSMGLLHVAVLRAVSPGIRLVLSDGLAQRRAAAEALGVERVVPAGSGELSTAAHEISDGVGVDAVFDCVGGARALEEGLAASRAGGSLVLFAHARAGEAAGFDLNALFKHERRVLGTYSGGLSEQNEVFELLSSGRLDPTSLITHRMPLSRFDEAVELCRSHAALKVLFVPEVDG
ncbi:MAG: alcohol dehydrogenase catalytic domain-containing protein [Acidobacteriota bacterium]